MHNFAPLFVRQWQWQDPELELESESQSESEPGHCRSNCYPLCMCIGICIYVHVHTYIIGYVCRRYCYMFLWSFSAASCALVASGCLRLLFPFPQLPSLFTTLSTSRSPFCPFTMLCGSPAMQLFQQI